jgi:hypothetical protein
VRAACGIQGDDFAPCRREKHYAVHNERGGFLSALSIQVEIPGKPKLADIPIGDLIERTEALLVVGPSV